jgi:hypothetical protein
VVVNVDEHGMVGVAMASLKFFCQVSTHIRQTEIEHARTKNDFIPSFWVQLILIVTPLVVAFPFSFVSLVLRSEGLLVTV